MMKIGIIAAMVQEMNTLEKAMLHKETIEKANQIFYRGTIGKNEVTLVQSGIGKVNAAIATTLLIELFDAEVVLNTGSAGGIGQGLSIGDLVISSELAHNDADARVFGYQFGQIPQMPSRYQASKPLIDTMQEAAAATHWETEEGLIVSGDSFISRQEQKDRIKKWFPDVLVTEMEGAAVAQTCYQFDVPFVVIRALSDTAGEDANVSFDTFIEAAGKKSAQTVLRFLSLTT